MPSVLFAFLTTLRAFGTLRRYLKDKRKPRRDFMFPKGNAHTFIHKFINLDAWDIYPVYKMAAYFEDIYVLRL